MSAYARDKTSKENVEVYDTNEVVDATNVSSGIVTALNDHLAIYVSGEISTSDTIPSGGNIIRFVPMSDELIDIFTTGSIAWKTGTRTIVDAVRTFYPGSSGINGVLIDYIAMAIQDGVIGLRFNISNNSSWEASQVTFMFTIIQIR